MIQAVLVRAGWREVPDKDKECDTGASRTSIHTKDLVASFAIRSISCDRSTMGQICRQLPVSGTVCFLIISSIFR